MILRTRFQNVPNQTERLFSFFSILHVVSLWQEANHTGLVGMIVFLENQSRVSLVGRPDIYIKSTTNTIEHNSLTWNRPQTGLLDRFNLAVPFPCSQVRVKCFNVIGAAQIQDIYIEVSENAFPSFKSQGKGDSVPGLDIIKPNRYYYSR
jgi:hypothetical protein